MGNLLDFFVLIVGLFRYILTDLIYVLCLFHTMSSFDIFKAQAEDLGLQGAEIGRYVVQQQAIEREQRTAEREEKRLLAEREEKAAEREAKAAERDFQLAKLQAEKEIELARRTGQGKITTSSCENVRGPKLPTYQEGEDINNFLVRFERVAELLKIDKDSYAARLGCLLTGKATELYTSLSAEYNGRLRSFEESSPHWVQ